MTTTIITTKSGSTYVIEQDKDGKRTLRADNVPNYRMEEIVGSHGVHFNEEPKEGERFSFLAPTFRYDWVTTSTVVSVEKIEA